MSKFSSELKNAFEMYPQLTIRQLAIATDTTYQMLLHAAHKPVVGEAYDPTAINWDAISDTLERKGIETLPNFEEMAQNKKAIIAGIAITDLAVGDRVKLKYESSVNDKETTYEILLMTTTHIVFMDVDGTQPRVMNHGVFSHQGPMKVA